SRSPATSPQLAARTAIDLQRRNRATRAAGPFQSSRTPFWSWSNNVHWNRSANLLLNLQNPLWCKCRHSGLEVKYSRHLAVRSELNGVESHRASNSIINFDAAHERHFCPHIWISHG